MRQTRHKPKRTRQAQDISRKATAQNLSWLLENPIFPLSKLDTRDLFIGRLKQISFQTVEMQQAFIRDISALVNCKHLPIELLYNKLQKIYDARNRKHIDYASTPFGAKDLDTFNKLIAIVPRNIAVWNTLILLLQKRDPTLVAQLFNVRFINKLSDTQVSGLVDFSDFKLRALIKLKDKESTLDKERLLLAFDLIRSCDDVFKTPYQLAGVIVDFLQKGYPLIVDKIESACSYQSRWFPIQRVRAWMDAWRVHAYKGQTAEQVSNIRLGYLLAFAAIPFGVLLRNIPAYFWYHLDTFESNESVLLHLASGKNIRKHPQFSFMTKKMAHQFHNMKAGACEPSQIIAYAMIESLTCVSGLGRSLLRFLPRGTLNGEEADVFKQWYEPLRKVIEWFSDFYTSNDFQTTMGYIQHCIYEIPGWSIAGRTYKATLDRARQWLIENRLKQIGGVKSWDGANYGEWNRTIDHTPHTIVQLTNSRDLLEEGQRMSHCVATYAGRCASGACSIWSLRRKDEDDKWESLVTIEVSRDHVVVQQRARFNSNPDGLYLRSIREWAAVVGVEVDR